MDSNVSDVDFKINDFVVYPSHGVGQIVDEEVQNIAPLSGQVHKN